MEKEKNYKICPECSYFCSIHEEDQYCVRCGTELITECPECGKAIDYPHGNFCKYCGSRMRGEKAFKREVSKGTRSNHSF